MHTCTYNNSIAIADGAEKTVQVLQALMLSTQEGHLPQVASHLAVVPTTFAFQTHPCTMLKLPLPQNVTQRLVA